jgi:hypothetical protein
MLNGYMSSLNINNGNSPNNCMGFVSQNSPTNLSMCSNSRALNMNNNNNNSNNNIHDNIYLHQYTANDPINNTNSF